MNELDWQRDVLQGIGVAADALVPDVDPKRHPDVASVSRARLRRMRAISAITDAMLDAIPKPIADPNTTGNPHG